MALNLMYITKNPQTAAIAQRYGVDHIFVDMECIGKEQRQRGMDTVKSNHTIEDLIAVRKVIDKSKILVRVNPIQPIYSGFDSKKEIDTVIREGADIVMLPMYKTHEEVKRFIDLVGGRVKTMLLAETPEAVELLTDTVELGGIDYMHIGLNDLHLAYGKKFMFELLSDGTVDRICSAIKPSGIPYGFGGIARLGYGLLPAENVITEHYRLKSSSAILSRSFCNAENIPNPEEIESVFCKELKGIRNFEEKVSKYTDTQYEENRTIVKTLVGEIAKKL